MGVFFALRARGGGYAVREVSLYVYPRKVSPSSRGSLYARRGAAVAGVASRRPSARFSLLAFRCGRRSAVRRPTRSSVGFASLRPLPLPRRSSLPPVAAVFPFSRPRAGGGSAGASPPLPSASVGAAGRRPPPTALRRPSWSAGSGIVVVAQVVCVRGRVLAPASSWLPRLRGGGCRPARIPRGGRGPLHPVTPPRGLVPSLLGWSAWGVCFLLGCSGSVRLRAAPPPPRGRKNCNVVPCRLPPLRARARCARAPLCYGSLVCLGWCASPPLPPAPLPHVGAGLAVLCSRGGSPVGICSPLMPSRGVVAAAGNRRRATTCGGRPWLRGAWSVSRGLVPSPTHSYFWHLGRRRVACCLPLGLGSAPQSRVVPALGGGVAVVLWGFIRHRASGRALFVACAPRGAWRSC